MTSALPGPPLIQPLPDHPLPDQRRRRDIREAAHLSRRQLADILGCHEQSVIRWEWGNGQVSSRYLVAYTNLLAKLDRESRAAAG